MIWCVEKAQRTLQGYQRQQPLASVAFLLTVVNVRIRVSPCSKLMDGIWWSPKVATARKKVGRGTVAGSSQESERLLIWPSPARGEIFVAQGEAQAEPWVRSPARNPLPLPVRGERVGVRGRELRKREQNSRFAKHNRLNLSLAEQVAASQRKGKLGSGSV